MKEFPPFRLDISNQCLWRRGDRERDERILLTPKAFAVLRYLVEHAGRLVTQDELLDAVWPDTFVQPEVLKYQIADIRSALGDRPKNPLFIETLPRRGYQFVAAVRETEPAETFAPVNPAQGRLVGRDRELGALCDCLRRTLKGHRQVVFITGEPGIGKTALVDEFLRQAAAEEPSLRIARGQCVEGYGGTEAYYPMLEALGQLCRGVEGNRVVEILATQAPTWLVQFPTLLKREHRQTLQQEILGATRERMLREIGEALRTITAESRLVILLEDLQWVDPSTVDFISSLARGRGAAGLMVIGTYRPVELVLSDHPLKSVKQDLLVHQLCHEIAVEPLGEAEVAEYLAAGLPEADLPPGLPGLLHRHTEGNPLFMIAALELMTGRNFISRKNGHWQLRVPLDEIDLDVPETLRHMIEAQIEHLTNEQQRALEAASVAGASFASSIGATAANLELETFQDLCETVSRRHHMIRGAADQRFPDGTVSPRYEFAHALYREVFYQRLSPGRRAKLHRRIGELLEVMFQGHLREGAAELAHHFERGLHWQNAGTYLRLIAETATRRLAHRETAAALQRSLELLKKLPDAQPASEIEILVELASIYAVSFETLPRAVETYEILASRAAGYGLIDVELRARVDMAYPLAWISSLRCVEVVKRAVVLAGAQGDAFELARTRAVSLVRKMGAAQASFRNAEDCRDALTDIRHAGDRLVLASLLSDYSITECDPLDFWAAVTFTSERGRCRYMHLLLSGEWSEALREVEAGITVVNTNRDSNRLQTLLLCRAWVFLCALDFAGVAAICDSVFASSKGTLGSATLRFCRVLAGSAEMALGNHEQALRHLQAVKRDMSRHMVLWDWYWRMMLESALTDAWLETGDLPAARSNAQVLINITLASGDRTWHALAWETNTRVAIAEGNLQRARDSMVKADATIETYDVPLAAWRVHATAAELYERTENQDLAEHHRQLSRTTILKLANSLPPEDRLRQIFLSAPMVRKIVGDGETLSSRAQEA